jgi:hypothetical protein
VQNSRNIKISEIFNHLDSDKDGLISKYKIYLGDIDPILLNILKPILGKLSGNRQSLNKA